MKTLLIFLYMWVLPFTAALQRKTRSAWTRLGVWTALCILASVLLSLYSEDLEEIYAGVFMVTVFFAPAMIVVAIPLFMLMALPFMVCSWIRKDSGDGFFQKDLKE